MLLLSNVICQENEREHVLLIMALTIMGLRCFIFSHANSKTLGMVHHGHFGPFTEMSQQTFDQVL